MTDNSTSDKEQFGLYEKYEVYQDGEPVLNCFVLEPETDEAAREAILAYAEAAEDPALSQDLREWMAQYQDTGCCPEEGDR